MPPRSPPSTDAGERLPPSQATVPSGETAPRSEMQALAVRWTGPRGQTVLSPLGMGTLRIGRNRDSDVVLESVETSRRHAEIERRGPAIEIRDGKSRNGVFCDGMKQSAAPLAEGTVVRLGDWVGVVIRGDAALREIAPGLWGGSRLERALADVRRAASSHLNLLLVGETGTGKELVARAIHQWSGRPGELVAVNCAALPESLAEAELFGHERGAFTGALQTRSGHVRAADGGVLFLDEIGELSLPVQAKLLRVLEERQVTPVGSSRGIAVDLHVVSATHRDLLGMVRAGTFREDLLARLEGVTFELPPLRERRGDIWPLFVRFGEAALGRPIPKVSARFMEALMLHPWPGNVRELRQLAERLAILSGSASEWHHRDLRALERRSSAAPASPVIPIDEPVSEPRAPRTLGREEIVRALANAQGVVASAARALKVSKQTLYDHARTHGIDWTTFRSRGRSKP